MTKHWWHESKYYTALLSFVLAAAFIIGCFALSYGNAIFLKKSASTKAAASKTLLPVGLPTRLMIPSIEVDAAVQQTGIAASGRMGVPTNFTDVAWYKLGPKPGEAGSAIIDGHLDMATDINAVFIRLNELKKGDEIDVLDAKGQKIKFRVTDTKIYDDTDAPLDTIFDKNGPTSRLNLITCDGAWDQATKNYNKRLVVYSERVVD